MNLKYLMFVLSLFSKTDQSNTFDHENKAFQVMRKAIRKEVFFLSFYILIGIICSSVVIFSFIQMSQAFQIFLKQYENALQIEIASFSFIALLSLVLFYYLFHKDSVKNKLDKQNKENKNLTLKIQTLGSQFLKGFLEGIK